MNFCSFEFVFFLVVLAVLYYIVRPSGRWMILLSGSLVFFAICGLKYLLYAVVLSAVFFFGANVLDGINARQSELDKIKDKEERKRLASKSRKILIAVIIFVVGNLVFHKYWNMLGELFNNIRAYFGGNQQVGWLDIALPLGLSYYTFSGLGYVLDVYWKRYRSQRNFAKFLLYITYFPHIIQGPIERYGLLEGQFFDEERIRFKGVRLKQAVVLMGYGYFKKLFVADRMSVLVNGVMADLDKAPGSMQLLAILLSAFWFYADFSGYMDIARGASMVFGIEINQNFNHPLLSRSIPEWWRRWHMSLCTWWRDYIYMPMATSLKFISKCAGVKKKYGKTIGKLFKDAVPIFLIWTTTGLWHGTGAAYLVWGIYFSVLFTLSGMLASWNKNVLKKLHINPDSKGFHIFQMVRTYLLFCGGRLFVTPANLEGSGKIIQKVFTDFNLGYLLQGKNYEGYGTCVEEVVFMLAGVVVILIVDIIEENKGERIYQWVLRRQWVIRGVIYAAFILAIAMFGIYGVDYTLEGFAYQNF